jgi:hypothetical protein
VLGLSGVKVDRIEATGRISQNRYREEISHMFGLFIQSCDLIQLLADWEEVVAARSRDKYITGESRIDAYWQTLCAGHMPEGIENIRKEFAYKYYKYLRPLRHVLKLAVRVFPQDQSEGWYDRSFYTLIRAAWKLFGLSPFKFPRLGFPPQVVFSNSRRIMRTRNGYIGLAPRYAEPGDWIGVFKGGNFPLVIRPDGPHWQLIGECYVHGIMNGEAWDDEKCEVVWLK